MLLVSKKHKRRFITWFLIIIVLFVTCVPVAISVNSKIKEFFVSIVDRVTSLFAGAKLFRSGSLEWRKIENKYAMSLIRKYPVFGIGLANAYRPKNAWLGDKGSYIHNGYLWIILKTGIVGFVPFLLFYIRFLIRGFRNWHSIKDTFLRAAVIGFTLSCTGIMLASIVNPLFTQGFSIIVISTMFGLTEVIIKNKKEETAG
jgi:O-antigen ligase